LKHPPAELRTRYKHLQKFTLAAKRERHSLLREVFPAGEESAWTDSVISAKPR